jgi:4-hydroxy-3-methylbut-2-enyl diphosphate reductase
MRNPFCDRLIRRICLNNYIFSTGRFRFFLARKFGFCSGVARSIKIAYQTLKRFHKRSIYITTEIIHNPFVNLQLKNLGVRFLEGRYKSESKPKKGDVVIIPSFGTTIETTEFLTKTGCTIVDTTCGSVLNLRKRVKELVEDGYSLLLHGRFHHEETQGILSFLRRLGSTYLVLQTQEDAEIISELISKPRNKLPAHLRKTSSRGFNPEKDLGRIGLVNQTTMLIEEACTIEEILRKAMIKRYKSFTQDHYRALNTICMATQQRQDATLELAKSGVDLMLVVGGFDSSNTAHLAKLGSRIVPTYHIEGDASILSPELIMHKSPFNERLIKIKNWLKDGIVKIGITAGASTPDVELGAVIRKIIGISTPRTLS